MKNGIPVPEGTIVSACRAANNPDRSHIVEKTSRGSALRMMSLLILVLLAALLPASANQPGGFVTTVTTPVTTGNTSYNGRPCVFMDNGIIHIIIDSAGNPASLRYLKPGLPGTPLKDGVEMEGQSSGSTSLYGGNYNINYSDPYNTMAFGNDIIIYATPPTAAQADYAFYAPYSPARGTNPWDTTVHWVLRQGDTGVYTYLVINHDPSYGPAGNAGLTLQWGSAHDQKNFLLENTYVDNMGAGLLDNRGLPEARRHGLSTSFEDENYIIDAVQDNYQIVNTDPLSKFYGYIDTKYSYIADLYSLDCWGRASDVNHLGGWFVEGSHEFSPSGPAYLDFVQGWGLVDCCLTGLHGIQTHYTIPQGTAFRKVYGPVLLYMNTLATGTANWADAQQQAVAEKAAWPYSWLTYEPAYQTPPQRATVTGTILITDQLNSAVNASGAWVGVTDPDKGYNTGGSAPFQVQQLDAPAFANHQYWVHAAPNGSFSFPNVATTDCYGNPDQYASMFIPME